MLATGGGAYMNEETRERCRAEGVTIWLKADVPVLLERVRKKGNRPLLDRPDPEGVMRQLLAEREPIYALADITIASREGPHQAVVGEIVAALDAHLERKAGAVSAERVRVELGARSYDVADRPRPDRGGRRADRRAAAGPQSPWSSPTRTSPSGIFRRFARRSTAAGIERAEIVVPPGEGSKSFEQSAERR